MLSVPFAASVHVSGVVRLRNNTGAGNTDQSGCRPQIAPAGGTFSDVGPEMLGLTNGFNTFNDEATVAVVGELNVPAGRYDARIVCHRTFSTGSTDQNKFNGDAISRSRWLADRGEGQVASGAGELLVSRRGRPRCREGCWERLDRVRGR